MRPGSTVIPATSITSALDGQVAADPVVTVSTRPSVITTVASRTGVRPVPSISVPPRRTSIVRPPRSGATATGVYAAAAANLDPASTGALVCKEMSNDELLFPETLPPPPPRCRHLQRRQPRRTSPHRRLPGAEASLPAAA